MHQSRRIVVVLLAGLLLTAGPASGQGILNPLGQPHVQVGVQPSYYVWVDQAGWHVRWSTPFAQSFSGFVASNGQISGICAAGGGLPPWVSLNGGRAIFGVTARPGIGGFDFVTSGSAVTFTLNINGLQIPSWLIFVGRNALRQVVPSFTLSAPSAFIGQTCREPHLSDVDRPVTDR